MAGQYAPMPPNPQYGFTEYAPVPPNASWGPVTYPATQYSPMSPNPPTSNPPTPYTPLDDAERKPPRTFTRSVSSFFSLRGWETQGPKYTTKSRPKSYFWHIVGHIVSFLWIAPIIALLVLNLTNHVIGPSAWCPGRHCPINVWDQNAVVRAKYLDKIDHNTLGALQMAAKALEVWFMFIATALIYDLAMILARREGGLPIGYLLTHLQFTDIRNLFNPHLWTSAIPHRHAPTSQQKSAARLMTFGIFTALLTILANLMGPAAAVLVLPSLKWVDTKHVPDQMFTAMHMDKPPSLGDAIPFCTEANLTAGNYSCTYVPYGPSLDHFAASATMTEVQNMQNHSLPIPSVSQESAVQFLVNLTNQDRVAWGANRQVLRDLSLDLFRLGFPDKYGQAATSLNDSLQVILNRQGPSIGFNAYCMAGNEKVIEVAEDKQIRCFGNWTVDFVSNYTKCFRVGRGFNPTNKYSNFSIGISDPAASVNSTAVDIFFSDRSIVYNDTTDFGSGIAPCLDPVKAPSCDWDKIFSTTMPETVRNMTANIGVISYSFIPSNETNATRDADDTSRIYCDTASYLGFPTYSLDTLPSTNPLTLVRLQGLKISRNSIPVIMDPAWLLAAFSVNENGLLAAKRKIAKDLQRILPYAWATGGNPLDRSWLSLQWLQLYVLTQTISIIPYESSNLTLAGVTAVQKKSKDVAHPVLHTWAARHVWAYGIGESRTSKLGVVVVSLGIICVLVRLLLGFGLGKREHSAVELIVAALEHHPTGEFEGEMDRRKWAKVRYVMEEDKDGKPRFVPERNYTWDFVKGKKKTFSWRGGLQGGGREGSSQGAGGHGRYGSNTGLVSSAAPMGGQTPRAMCSPPVGSPPAFEMRPM